MAVATDEVLFTVTGGVGVATLNRPAALNALTTTMVEALDAAYRSWDADPGIHAIVLTGSGGGRALCAGGDVKAAVAAVRSGDPGAAVRFFRSEYRLDYLIATLTTPHIALMDGIVMGGGAGLCVHGRFRVATERTVFAMPECAIGLFPDVGTTHFLSQTLRGRTGAWLGLTGARLAGADVWHAGVATHYVRSADLAALVAGLGGLGPRRRGGWLGRRLLREKQLPPAPAGRACPVRAALDACQAGTVLPPPSPTLSLPVRTAMDACFSGASVAEVRAALEREEAASPAPDPAVRQWAGDALRGLARGSPFSLALTLALLSAGARSPLGAALRLEWRAVLAALAAPDTDFCVGVVGRLVDKGRAGEPAWMAEAGVAGAVAAALAPLAPGEELELTVVGGGGRGERSRL